MRAKLANLNHCAVPFLSRTAANLSWNDSIYYILYFSQKIAAAQNEVALNNHRVRGL